MPVVFFDLFYIVYFRPYRIEIKLVPASLEACRTENFFGDGYEKIAHQCLAGIEIHVCGIEFHIGKFLQMVGARAFVAVHAADLERLLETGSQSGASATARRRRCA